MITPQHIFVRITGAQENAYPRQQKHRRRQFVVPTQDTQIRDHIESPGILRQTFIGSQREVGTITGGQEQPRGAPHVLVEVARGVVIWLDEKVSTAVRVSSVFVSSEGEHGLGSSAELLGVGVILAENNGGGGHRRRHLGGEFRCGGC